MSTHNFRHLLFDNDTKNICIFRKWCWESSMSICRKIKVDTYLSCCTKINYKCVKDLSMKPEILKLPEENIGSILHDTGTAKDSLPIFPKCKANN